MNQPELGKKIAELRKSKGLTQEDLVSKCNLTVRTLQRIESGVLHQEVTLSGCFSLHWITTFIIIRKVTQKKEYLLFCEKRPSSIINM